MKVELRKDILHTRRGMSKEEVTSKSQLISDKVLSLTEYKQAKVVMLYLDFRNEVVTTELLQKTLANGQRVVIPVTDIKNTALIPSEIINYPDDITAGTWGIPEPKSEALRPIEPTEIDIVIVPGVAFDVKGNRLGYGGGFYDRFLLRTKPGTIFVALAFELQIKDEVYPEKHDHPVHYVITEERVIKC